MSNWPERLLTAGHVATDRLLVRQLEMLRETVPVIYAGFFSIAAGAGVLIASYSPLPFALAPVALIGLILAARYRFWRDLEPASLPRVKVIKHLYQTLAVVPAIGLISCSTLIVPPLLFGTQADTGYILACILLGTVVSGICYVMLPMAAFAMFATAAPAILLPALWYGSPPLLALGVLYLFAATLGTMAIFRQFVIISRLVESEHKAAEALASAAEAEKVKADFLSSMSHEIRTPLNGVLGMAELLSRSDLSPSQKNYVGVITNSGNTLLATINGILDLSRLEAGSMVLDPAPFRMSDVVEEVVQSLAGQLQRKDVELIQRIDPFLPEYLVGDSSRFRQIVNCLVANAVRFTTVGHVLIDVSAHVEKGMAFVTVRVEDTGCGIARDRLPGIFSSFYQSRNTPAEVRPGAGLGLSVASRLVALMHGDMHVDSTPGKGSTFWFTLPMDILETTQAPAHLPTGHSGSRVLVIDDNEVNRMILLEQLHSWEFKAAAVENGWLGLAFLEESLARGTPVDCVVLDYQMPDMNGADVAQRLRSIPAFASLPVVLLSSVDLDGVIGLPFDTAATAKLTKPARSGALKTAITDLIRQEHARRTQQAAPGTHAGTRSPLANRALRRSDEPAVEVLSILDDDAGHRPLPRKRA